MTKYAEVIYETGAKSVVSYENEDELKSGLHAHNERAINGLPGSAQDWSERDDIEPELARQAAAVSERPAERVKKVYLYDKHPVDLHTDRVNVDTLKELVNGMTDENGTLDSSQLISALRDEVSPVLPLDQGRHESIFKANSSGELDLSFLSPPDTTPESNESSES